MIADMHFTYAEQSSWPELSWIARVSRGSHEIEVFHGARVETRAAWFGEIAWVGELEDGEFDKTDIVAGSGARLRRGAVDFVSAGSTIDRLQLVDRQHELLISNSLALLLAFGELSLDPSYPNYINDINTVTHGLRKMVRHLGTTSEDRIELVYHDNVRWDGQSARRVSKPFPVRDFSTFESYLAFLRGSLDGMSRNLHDTRRAHPFKMVTTISSGYDSPTIAAIARDFGCKTALTFSKARFGDDDSGVEVGAYLGLETIVAETGDWKDLAENDKRSLDALFYATSGFMGECPYACHEESLRGSMVLTGYHGDVVWALDPGYEGDDLVRGDASGLSLTEYRLHAGFINCPVPFFGARQIEDIQEMSRRPEMAPWSLEGRSYDRPFCRRVVEEAGVPRDLFGMHKKAVGVPSFYLSPSSSASYKAFLRDHQGKWLSEGRLPPIRDENVDKLIDWLRWKFLVWLGRAHKLGRMLGGLARSNSGAARLRGTGGSRSAQQKPLVQRLRVYLYQRRNMQRYVVPWALEVSKRAFGKVAATARKARAVKDV